MTFRKKSPLTAGHLASAGATVAAVILIGRMVAGEHDLLGIPQLAWPGVVVLLIGAVAGAASVRPWGDLAPVRLVTAALVLVGASAAVGSAFVLLNLIDLVVTGTVGDRHGHSDWSTFVERLVGATLAVLFVAAALSWHRRTSGGCTRCGGPHDADAVQRSYPAPHAAPRMIRWTAYVGCAAFLPYLTLHALNLFVLPGHDGLYEHDGAGLAGEFDGPLLLVFAALAVGLVGPAVFLLLGLVRPWGMVFPRWTLLLAGRRVPRFLPLAPVWLVAPTLALYGVGSVPYAIVTGQGEQLWGLGGAASLAFAGYGCALAVAAASYWSRARPRCGPSTAVSSERPDTGEILRPRR